MICFTALSEPPTETLAAFGAQSGPSGLSGKYSTSKSEEEGEEWMADSIR